MNLGLEKPMETETVNQRTMVRVMLTGLTKVMLNLMARVTQMEKD